MAHFTGHIIGLTCPICGDRVPVRVVLDHVNVFPGSLQVIFGHDNVTHLCDPTDTDGKGPIERFVSAEKLEAALDDQGKSR